MRDTLELLKEVLIAYFEARDKEKIFNFKFNFK